MMQCIVAIALLVVLANGGMVDRELLITETNVREINKKAKTWTASADQGKLSGATIKQLKSLMGVRNVKLPANVTRRTYSKEFIATLPDSFDSAKQWPHCATITQIRDQSACGSCWAFGAAEAISDRYCTFGGQANLTISANNLVACCDSCGYGCDGGDPIAAWQYWTSTGLVDDYCDPYPYPACEHHVTPAHPHFPPCPSNEYPTPECTQTCKNGKSWSNSQHFGTSAYGVSGEDDYKAELFSHGPFEVAFTVYDDFPTYKGGVYQQTSQNALGGHAVRIVGWGNLNGTPYWKIANSWNVDWGLNGYFLILRGADECGIEDSGAAGAPKL